MPQGKLEKVRYRSRKFGTVEIYRADEDLQRRLPKLNLPPMNEAARAAFRAVIDCEKPPANSSLSDHLALAEARGYSAHPGDWMPHIDLPGQHLQLYQPWVEWLSEHGFTQFHEYANNLTDKNWDRWKPGPRLRAFERLVLHDQDAAFELLKTMAPSQSASTRLSLLGQIGAGASFSGVYPRQVPLIRYFLEDRSAKVRDAAEAKLTKMNGLETEEAHAAELAKHLIVTENNVTYKVPPEPHTFPFWINWHCTTFDDLAGALGLAPEELARRSDIEGLGSNFYLLVTLTAGVEARSIIASRLLDEGKPENIGAHLFKGVARALWERGLRATFRSNYWNSVQEFLDPERGTLDASQMRELLAYEKLEASMTKEFEEGGAYDPLRAVALSVNKTAAAQLLEKALSLGMKIDNPRLITLKFNMAL
jgi:hypothetical protein